MGSIKLNNSYHTDFSKRSILLPAHIQDIKMPFPFQRLPIEIRHTIYLLTLCIPGEISPIGAGVNGRWSNPFDPDKQLSIGVGLLRTCKEVELEAAPVLYDGNKFLLTHDGAGDESAGTFPFLVKVGRRNRQALHQLVFHVYFCKPTAYEKYSRAPRALGDSFDLLAQSHNLHVLKLRFVDRGTGHAYRQFFTVALPIVAKMKKIKNVKQLVLKGEHSKPSFKIDGISPDAAVNSEAVKPMTESIRLLQKGSLTEAQVAQIIEEKLLLLQAGIGETVKAELKSLKGGLTAQAQAEKSFRDSTRDSIAGLALKSQAEEISKVLEALRTKVDALSSRI